MTETKVVGVRARVRAELTAEIKRVATEQLAAEGPSGLSLRAIARELGMASSAIYRYFASRDELLTSLIIDAYNASGQLIEDADRACERTDYKGRFVAIARALRAWAVENPHQYALIYGSPVPGYAAPQDTIDPATRLPIALLTTLVEARAPGNNSVEDRAPGNSSVEDESSADFNGALQDALAELMEYTGHLISPHTLAVGVEAWAELFGLVSLELFGHFRNSITDPEAFFDHAVKAMADRMMP